MESGNDEIMDFSPVLEAKLSKIGSISKSKSDRHELEIQGHEKKSVDEIMVLVPFNFLESVDLELSGPPVQKKSRFESVTVKSAKVNLDSSPQSKIGNVLMKGDPSQIQRPGGKNIQNLPANKTRPTNLDKIQNLKPMTKRTPTLVSKGIPKSRKGQFPLPDGVIKKRTATTEKIATKKKFTLEQKSFGEVLTLENKKSLQPENMDTSKIMRNSFKLTSYLADFENQPDLQEKLPELNATSTSAENEEDFQKNVTYHDVYLKSIVNTLDETSEKEKETADVIDEVRSQIVKDKVLRYQFKELPPSLRPMEKSKEKQKAMMGFMHEAWGEEKLLDQQWNLYKKMIKDIGDSDTDTTEELDEKTRILRIKQIELNLMLKKFNEMKDKKSVLKNYLFRKAKSDSTKSQSSSSKSRGGVYSVAGSTRDKTTTKDFTETQEYTYHDGINAESGTSSDSGAMSCGSSSSRDIPILVDLGIYSDERSCDSAYEVETISLSDDTKTIESYKQNLWDQTFLTRALKGNFDLIDDSKANLFEECLCSNQVKLKNLVLRIIKNRWFKFIISGLVAFTLLSIILLSAFCCVFFDWKKSCNALLYCLIFFFALVVFFLGLIFHKKFKHLFPSNSLHKVLHENNKWKSVILLTLQLIMVGAMIGEVAMLDNPSRLIGLIYPMLLLVIGYLISFNPNLICFDLVLNNLLSQIIMGYMFLRFPVIKECFETILDKFYFTLSTYDYGFKQIFKVESVAARSFHWMAIMLFIGIFNYTVDYMGWILLSMNVIGAITKPFNGLNHVESSISNLGIILPFTNMFQAIKHYLILLSDSQIHLMLTVLFSASPIAFQLIQMTMGIPLEISCVLTLMNVPGSIAVSKLLCPELKETISTDWLTTKSKHESTTFTKVKDKKAGFSCMRRILNMISAGGLNSFKMYGLLLTSTITGLSIYNCLNFVFGYIYSIVDQSLPNEAKFDNIFNFRFVHSRQNKFEFNRILSWLSFPIFLSTGFPPNEALFAGEIASRTLFVNNIAAAAEFSEHLHSRWLVECHTEFKWRHWKDFKRPFIRIGREIFLINKYDVSLVRLPGPHFSGRSEIMLVPLISSQLSIMYSAITLYSLSLILPSSRSARMNAIVKSASFASLLTSFMTSTISGLFYSEENQLECYRQFKMNRESMCKSFFQLSELFIKNSNFTLLDNNDQSYLSSLCYIVNRKYVENGDDSITITTEI